MPPSRSRNRLDDLLLAAIDPRKAPELGGLICGRAAGNQCFASRRMRCPVKVIRGWLVASLVLVAQACGGTPAAPAAPPPPPPPVQAAVPEAPASDSRHIAVELRKGPVPWTHLNARNAGESFQFAIVADRTGGVRRGVFASAIPKLNLLEPELVMSVGDLIAGYTQDRARLKRQWDEFDALVRRLKAPFFYVPGNHDLTNETMHDV